MGGAFSSHGEMRNAYKMFLESLKGRDCSEDLGVDVRIILKLISGKLCLRVWISMA
jgi:hypothetical protein